MTTGRINQISIGAGPAPFVLNLFPFFWERKRSKEIRAGATHNFCRSIVFFFFFVCLKQKKKSESFFSPSLWFKKERKKKVSYFFSIAVDLFSGLKKSYSRYCCKLRPVFVQPKFQLQFRESANSFFFFFFEEKKIENTAAHKGIAKKDFFFFFEL